MHGIEKITEDLITLYFIAKTANKAHNRRIKRFYRKCGTGLTCGIMRVSNCYNCAKKTTHHGVR